MVKNVIFAGVFGVLIYLGQAGRGEALLQARLREMTEAREQLERSWRGEGKLQAADQPALALLRAGVASWERDVRAARLAKGDELELKLARAALANAEGRFAEALSGLSQVELESAGPRARETVLLLRGEASAGLRQWPDALPVYEQLAKSRPASLGIASRLAEVQTALGQAGESAAALERLAESIEAEIRAALWARNFEGALRLANRAVELRARMSERESTVDRIVQQGEAIDRRGVVLLWQNDPAKGLENFRAAVDLLARVVRTNQEPRVQSALARSHRNAGGVHLLQNRAALALEPLQKSAELFSVVDDRSLDSAATLIQLGNAHLMQGRPDLAAAQFSRSAELMEPQRAAGEEATFAGAIAWNSLGSAYLAQGQAEPAAALFDRAIEALRQLSNPEARKELGLALNNRGVVNRARKVQAQAEADFTAAIEAMSSLPALSAPQLGEISAGQFKLDVVLSFTENAIEVLSRARVLDPFQRSEPSVALALAFKNRAYARLAQRQPGTAIPDFDRAAELLGALVEKEGQKDLAPQLARVLTPYAWLQATHVDESIRNATKALGLATKACELTEWRAFPAIEALAAAHAANSRYSEAQRFQERALALAPPAQQPAMRSRLELYRAQTPFRAEP